MSGLVRSQLHADPLSGHLFVFINRKADRLKILYWDRDAICVWYRRLERGRFHFPAADAASLELTPGQLQMIFDDVDVEHVRRFKLIFDTTNSYLPSSQGVMSFALGVALCPPCEVAMLTRLGFRPLPKPLGPSVISPA